MSFAKVNLMWMWCGFEPDGLNIDGLGFAAH